MAKNIYKEKYLNLLKNKFGKIEKLGTGYNLFFISATDVIVYFRYSKIHNNKKRPYTFYGLREDDIKLIKNSSKQSFLILLSPEEDKNLFIPFNRFEAYFSPNKVNQDKQYKINHYFTNMGNVVDFSNIGKFGTEKFRDFKIILNTAKTDLKMPELSHGQIQSLVRLIGISQGYDLFFPQKDYNEIDQDLIQSSQIRSELPKFNETIDRIIREIDIIWIKENKLENFFEVEHSTPIYSGLL